MNDFNWSGDACEMLKRDWGEGHSASECADRLMEQFGGVLTRSAVIGKKSRMHLTGTARNTHPPKQKSEPMAEKKPRKLVHRHRIVRWGVGSAMRVVRAVEFEDEMSTELSADAIPLHQRKQLLDLEQHHCRWPYGDPGKPDFFFCGATAIKGSSYCHAHFSLSIGQHRPPMSEESNRLRRVRALDLIAAGKLHPCGAYGRKLPNFGTIK